MNSIALIYFSMLLFTFITKINVRLFSQTYIFASINIMRIIRFGMTNKLKYFSFFFTYKKNRMLPLNKEHPVYQ